jgi:DUF438 domain-containing protein
MLGSGRSSMKGKLPDVVLASLLETLPVEFSIVDAEDKVLAWNRHESRVFRRTENVLGRDVQACHPGKSLAKVEAIISEMKSGRRETAEFWIDMKLDGSPETEKILIQYFALRDEGESTLAAWNVPQIAEVYKREWERLWAESR